MRKSLGHVICLKLIHTVVPRNSDYFGRFLQAYASRNKLLTSCEHRSLIVSKAKLQKIARFLAFKLSLSDIVQCQAFFATPTLEHRLVKKANLIRNRD